MLNHADAFIFLLGDLATLEALITLISWAHLNIHQKPIGLLNVNNFYDSFIAFLIWILYKLIQTKLETKYSNNSKLFNNNLLNN